MIVVDALPPINAALNATSLCFLLSGYRFIRAKRITPHKRCMLAAFAASGFFLAGYVTYHVLGEERRFQGPSPVRVLYLVILFSHVTLAAITPVLASITLVLGLLGRIPRHRRIAKVTFPVWLYVSVTGIVVYFFLLWGASAPIAR